MAERVVFDPQGEPLSVDDTEIDAAYRAGQIRLPEQEHYDLRRPDGRVVQVPRAEINQALQDPAAGGLGYRLATGEQATEQRRANRFGDSSVRAFAESVASGASATLLDPVLAQAERDIALLGGASVAEAEEARRGLVERRERSPTAALAGEVTGGVVGAILPVGPAGLLARAGAGVGRAVAGAGARVGARSLGRAAGLAAEGTVEGALYGAAQATTEAALEDRELTAENVLAGLGRGALYGSVAGGALGTAGAAVGAGVRGLTRAAAPVVGQVQAVGRQTREAIQSLYQRAAGDGAAPLADSAVDLYARGASAVTGADRETVRAMTGLSPDSARLRRDILDRDALFESTTRQGRELLDDAERFSRSVQNEAVGGFKADNVRRLTRGRDIAPAAREADELLSRIGAQADEMIADARSYGHGAALNRIRDDVDIIRRRLAAATDDDDIASAFVELDNFKRRIGRDAQPGRMVNDSADSSSLARIRDWYEQSRKHLEDTDLYGDAASAQREINAAWAKYLDSSQLYRREFLTQTGTDQFNPVFTHDPAKLEGFLKLQGRAKNDLASETFNKHAASQQELISVIARHTELTPQARAALEQGRATSKAMGSWFDETRERIGAINNYDDIVKQSASTSGLGVGALAFGVGAMLGGPALGGLTSAAAGILTRPDQMIRTLAALERINVASGEKIRSAVKRFMTGAAPAAARAGREARAGVRAAAARVRPAARAAGRAARLGTVYAVSEYGRRSEQVREAATDRRALLDRVAGVSSQFADVAPEVGSHVTQGAIKAVDFLASKLPPGRVDTLQPHLAKPRVTDQEQARWLRYAAAVDDPWSVVEDFGNGIVNREGAETLRVLYPRMFATMRTAVLEQLTAMREPLPYGQRIQLGIVLQAPTDPSLRPEMIATLQASYAQPGVAAGEAPAPQPQAEITAPDIAGTASLASEMDAFEARASAA